ncbi:type II secretion system protein N [Alkanindiges sp. WGS2144]|uniref:type II secretion system protein N n=1 Tax=Alkanindiges sp. WGS2144 TaxID=3366808 RepID=UPI0037505069
MRQYFSRQYLSLKQLDLLAPWLLFILIVWLCWKIAALIWLLLAPPQPPVARDVALSYQSSTHVPNLSGFSLFKENRVDLPSGSNSEQQLPLKLEGVFLGNPVYRSAAVIRVNNQSSRYRVGEQIEGTSQRLLAVAWDHITLRSDSGQEATLYFGDEAANSTGQSMPSRAATPAVDSAQQAQNAIGDAIQQLRNNPSAYLSQMGVQATGQGYEITAAAPAELRNKLGLRPGDRIMSLNGRPLGQVQNDVRLLEQIRQQRSAQIEIRRGEQTMTIQQSF